MEEASSKVTIQFRSMDGRTIKILAGQSWTIRELKNEYGRQRGPGHENLMMHYKGRRLKDTDTVASYKFDPEGFIQVVQRSTGGYL